MYSGTMIEDLIKTVQQAERHAERAKQAKALVHKPTSQVDVYPFFYQMQSMTQIQIGVA